jgi:hypothetical protein
MTAKQRITLYSAAVDSYYLYAQEDEQDKKMKMLIEMTPFFDIDTIDISSIGYQNDLRILNGLGYVDIKRYTDSSAIVRYGNPRITEKGWRELVKEYERRKQS